MSRAPAIPFYADAYIADTMHLTLEEHGAYLMLLLVTWRNNGQPLPDDDARLARILGITPRKWSKLRPSIETFFDTSTGFWIQRRLTKEWEYVTARIEKSRANGALGGRPAGAKLLDQNGQRNESDGEQNESDNPLKNKETTKATGSVRDNPEQTQEQSQTKTTHPHPHPHKEKENPPTPLAGGKDPPDGFAEFWAAYPRKVGKRNAEKAYRAALKRGWKPPDLQAACEIHADGWRRSGTEPEFIPHPATWLNGDRGHDDPAGSGKVGELVPSAGGSGEPWAMRIEMWRRKPESWRETHYGPPPGKPGCRVPQEHLLDIPPNLDKRQPAEAAE